MLAHRTPALLACLLLQFAGVLCCTLAQAVPSTRPEVVRTLPHDSAAFTQGLLLHEGLLYESTGLRGSSSLRRVQPEDGAVIERVDLPPEEFGEGLALVSDRLVQLTWQEQVAHIYELETLAEVGSFNYEGEGWGLCFDGSSLVMSDGSDTLFFRDPSSFEVLKRQTVTRDGVPVSQLNELECEEGLVLANVWMSDTIVVIEPNSGDVLMDIDASGLLEPDEAAAADVLNGIAFDETSGNYLLTGKLWPKLFEVKLDISEPARSEPKSRGGCSMSVAEPAGLLWPLVLVALGARRLSTPGLAQGQARG